MMSALSDQHFLAFSGLKQWARATAQRAKALSDSQRAIVAIDNDRFDPLAQEGKIYNFHTEKYFSVCCCRQLLYHIEWTLELGIVDQALLEELEPHYQAIKRVRDLNEHSIEYFKGSGRRRREWLNEAEDGTADMSSVIETRIGNLLDWVVVGDAASRLYDKIATTPAWRVGDESVPDEAMTSSV